jgi:hypothetical protein
MSPEDVDVETHQYYKNNFLNDSNNKYRFFISEQVDCKSFIESEIMLPLAAYTLTRFGKLSMGYTKPPFANNRMQILNKSNVLDPSNIRSNRSLNERRFFNEIDWYYDSSDDGKFTQVKRALDTISLSKIRVTKVLPIRSLGARSLFDFDTLSNKRTSFLLSRYKNGAVMIPVTVMYKIATVVEAGDVVCVDDNGDLQIVDFENAERNLGVRLFEVVDRQLDLKTGQGKLQLLSGVGGQLTDRYASIAPSSLVSTGSTPSDIVFKDSFGAIFPGNEYLKWSDYVGLKIRVHDFYYSRSEIVTLSGISPSNKYKMTVSPALSFVPQENDIIDLAEYPDNDSKTDQNLAKAIHAYLTPQVFVESAASDLIFNVPTVDADKFLPGALVLIHNDAYSILSPECEIDSVAGQTITLKTSLGFTPSAGQRIDVIGFKDGGAAYRFV